MKVHLTEKGAEVARQTADYFRENRQRWIPARLHDVRNIGSNTEPEMVDCFCCAGKMLDFMGAPHESLDKTLNYDEIPLEYREPIGLTPTQIIRIASINDGNYRQGIDEMLDEMLKSITTEEDKWDE
jgi:hypothetical protein